MEMMTFPHSKLRSGPSHDRFAQELFAQEPESPRKQVDPCLGGWLDSEGRGTTGAIIARLLEK